MTEWQGMTDDERRAHMAQYVGELTHIMSVDEWQKSQQSDYPRFTPRWTDHRVQEIDVSDLQRGVLLDGRFWMRFEEIADVAPYVPDVRGLLPLPGAPKSAHAGSLRYLVERIFALLEQDLEKSPEDRYGYSDDDDWDFLKAAVRAIQSMGYTRQDMMQAWDQEIP